MSSLISYPFFLPDIFLLLGFCKPKLNQDFMNPVMSYVFFAIPINHSFQSVSRHSVFLISLFYNVYLPLLNYFHWTPCFLSYLRNFSCRFIYLFYLIKSSDRYICYFPSLIGCSTII